MLNAVLNNYRYNLFNMQMMHIAAGVCSNQYKDIYLPEVLKSNFSDNLIVCDMCFSFFELYVCWSAQNNTFIIKLCVRKLCAIINAQIRTVTVLLYFAFVKKLVHHCSLIERCS